jgi:predicted HD superfamily hydrolase involved in NAD metabolism
MTERQRAERLLVERRLSPELESHSRGVAQTAETLAGRWGASPDDAAVAGLLHDWARELPRQEVLTLARKHGLDIGPIEEDYTVALLHAQVAAEELAEHGFSPAIVEAVRRHTLGGPGMSVLDKCVFVADAIEPGRTWSGVEETRRRALESLDAAVLELARRDLVRLRARGREPHPLMLALVRESRGDEA